MLGTQKTSECCTQMAFVDAEVVKVETYVFSFFEISMLRASLKTSIDDYAKLQLMSDIGSPRNAVLQHLLYREAYIATIIC